MTRILWQGHEVDAYQISTNNNLENAGAIDAAFGRTGMKAGRSGSGELYSRPDWAATNEIWHRFRHMSQTYSVGMIIWAAVTAAGAKVAQIIAADATHGQFQAVIGGAMTNVGLPFPLQLAASVTRFDVHLNAVAVGQVELWYGAPGAQAKVVDTTGNYSGAAAIVRIYHGCTASGGGWDTDVAEEIVQTTSTLSSTSEIKPPTSDGTDVDGTGTYADLDEISYSDADLLVLAAAGLHHSFKSAARTQTQDVVTGVTLSCRAWYEAGGPTQIKPYLTIAGVRYYGTTFALDLVPLAYQYTFDNNPATAVAFTTAEANDAALEYGWEAVA